MWPPEQSRRSSPIAALAFITADDAKDYFFHRDALNSSLDFDRLNGGEKVEFTIEQSPRGPRAANVKAA